MAFFNRFLTGKQDVREEEQQHKPGISSDVRDKRCQPKGVLQNASQKKEIYNMQSDSVESSSLFCGMTINVIPKQTEKQKVDEVNSPSPLSTGVSTNVQELQDLLGGQVFSGEPVLTPQLQSAGSTLPPTLEITKQVTMDKDVDSVTNQEMQSTAVPLRKSGSSKKKKKSHSRPGYANVLSVTTTAGVNEKQATENTQTNQNDFQCTENKDEVLDTTEVDFDVDKDRKATVSSPGLDRNSYQRQYEEKFDNKTQIKDVTAGSQDQKPTAPLYTIGTPSSSEESLNEKETTVVYTNTSEDESVAHSDSQYGDDYLCQEADLDQSGAQKELKLTKVDILLDAHTGTEKQDLEKCLADQISPEWLSEKGEREVGSKLMDQVDNTFIQDTGAGSLKLEKPYNNAFGTEQQLTTDINFLLRTQGESMLIQETADVPVRDVGQEENAILIQETKDSIHVNNFRTCDHSNVTSDGEDQLVMVERHLQEQLQKISDQELCIQLEQSVLAQFASYSEKELKKEELLKSLQEDESQALLNDNYDLAEELSEKIDNVTMELDKMRNLLPGEDSEVQQLLQLECNVKQRKIGVYEEAQTALVKLKEQESSSLTNEQQAKKLRISEEKTWISSESLRIERDFGHLKLDKEHLEKGQSQLEVEILEKTRDFYTKRDDLLQQRQEVQVEITSLEKQLQLLRVKESEYTSAIDEETEKIAEVKRAYAPQKNLLEQQKEKIEEAEQALETDKHNLQTAQDELQKRVMDLQDTEERFERLLERIGNFLETCDETINAFRKDCSDIEEYRFGRQLAVTSSDKDFSRLRQAVSESESRVKSLSAQLQQTERSILALRKRLNEMEAQIAELHEAKEKSKAERNFKEAKRLKEEVDLLTAEGVASQKKLESLQQQLAQDSSSLEEAQIENTKVGEELRKKEYKADMNTIQMANEVLLRLGKLADRFKEKKILKILLDAEVTICQNLIEELCKKHGVSNDSAYGGDVERESDETEEACERCEPGTEENSSDVTCKLFQEMSDQLDVLEGKLEAVMEIEDYDEADRINQEIIQLKAERDKFKS